MLLLYYCSGVSLKCCSGSLVNQGLKLCHLSIFFIMFCIKILYQFQFFVMLHNCSKTVVSSFEPENRNRHVGLHCNFVVVIVLQCWRFVVLL